MRKRFVLTLLCAAVPAALLSCTIGRIEEEVDREAEIAAVAKSIDACIGWFEEKDFDLLFSVVAHDSNYVSVHPTDNVVMGFAEFEKNAEVFRYEGFKYDRHEISDLKITMSKSGDTAWFYCVLDDMNTWDGQPANWEDTRWTGVLEKREGRWVIVQQHFSFASE
jgi:ketosteroid isomerase-like protein